jgi:DNA-binding transcriptional ArsR family regulator
MAAELGISQPAVSQQLAVLREAGLVSDRSEGRFRIYRLAPNPWTEMLTWLRHCESLRAHRKQPPDLRWR